HSVIRAFRSSGLTTWISGWFGKLSSNPSANLFERLSVRALTSDSGTDTWLLNIRATTGAHSSGSRGTRLNLEPSEWQLVHVIWIAARLLGPVASNGIFEKWADGGRLSAMSAGSVRGVSDRSIVVDDAASRRSGREASA